MQPIPVTIITGFLGAGKTTLLNNVIKAYPDKKFAVIENEFGAIGIDGGLIVGAKDNIFELSNGCICCSLSDDFYVTLENLFNSGKKFDHLFIETTGIADPNGVVGAFMSSDALQKAFVIDSVICLADAVTLDDMMDEQPEVNKQLALADIVLLNKVDSVSQQRVKELEELIKVINPMADIYPTSHANIDNIKLLETYAYNRHAVEKSTLSFRNIAFRPNMNSATVSKLKHSVISEGFSIPGSFEASEFCQWIQDFLFFNSKTIFRAKGVLSFVDDDHKYVFQAVGGQYMLEASRTWDEPRFCKLVFIGRNINRDKIEDTLYSFVK